MASFWTVSRRFPPTVRSRWCHVTPLATREAGVARRRPRWGCNRRIRRSAGNRGARRHDDSHAGVGPTNGPACYAVHLLKALSVSRAESSDRRVSGPSVERARLRGRVGWFFRPSLRTHFGWRPAINSELARTRGIRLSN